MSILCILGLHNLYVANACPLNLHPPKDDAQTLTLNLTPTRPQEGDAFAAGDVLAEIETDKASIDFVTEDEGFVARLLVPDGSQDVKVGAPIIVVVDDEADVPAFKDFVPESAGYVGGGEENKGACEPSQNKQHTHKYTLGGISFYIFISKMFALHAP